jgi:hypothetical protein
VDSCSFVVQNGTFWYEKFGPPELPASASAAYKKQNGTPVLPVPIWCAQKLMHHASLSKIQLAAQKANPIQASPTLSNMHFSHPEFWRFKLRTRTNAQEHRRTPKSPRFDTSSPMSKRNRPKKMKPQIGANHRNWVQITGGYRKSPGFGTSHHVRRKIRQTPTVAYGRLRTANNSTTESRVAPRPHSTAQNRDLWLSSLQGRREGPSSPSRQRITFFTNAATVLPLPKGEGWGEGKEPSTYANVLMLPV